jgi:2-polyprenyl-3-methyl-5-hydroxy-6-metoxy-1,4-benzoquinol methylase
VPAPATDLVADLSALVPRPDLGASRWRHPAVVRRFFGPAAAYAVEACRGRERVLDVGCGYGTVALELDRAGHRVTAIDASEEACAVARRTLAGTNAVVVHATFGPDDLHEGAFDAVRFGRSLHHVADVAVVAERAALVLAPGGTLVVEEFCAERVDHATAAWLASLASSLVAAGDAEPGGIEDAAAVEDLWARKRRELALRTGAEMWTALEARFVLGEPVWFPYLWVDVAKQVADEGRAAMVAELAEGSEAAMIAAETIPGVAFRATGTVR